MVPQLQHLGRPFPWQIAKKRGTDKRTAPRAQSLLFAKYSKPCQDDAHLRNSAGICGHDGELRMGTTVPLRTLPTQERSPRPKRSNGHGRHQPSLNLSHRPQTPLALNAPFSTKEHLYELFELDHPSDDAPTFSPSQVRALSRVVKEHSIEQSCKMRFDECKELLCDIDLQPTNADVLLVLEESLKKRDSVDISDLLAFNNPLDMEAAKGTASSPARHVAGGPVLHVVPPTQWSLPSTMIACVLPKGLFCTRPLQIKQLDIDVTLPSRTAREQLGVFTATDESCGGKRSKAFVGSLDRTHVFIILEKVQNCVRILVPERSADALHPATFKSTATLMCANNGFLVKRMVVFPGLCEGDKEGIVSQPPSLYNIDKFIQRPEMVILKGYKKLATVTRHAKNDSHAFRLLVLGFDKVQLLGVAMACLWLLEDSEAFVESADPERTEVLPTLPTIAVQRNITRTLGVEDTNDSGFDSDSSSDVEVQHVSEG